MPHTELCGIRNGVAYGTVSCSSLITRFEVAFSVTRSVREAIIMLTGSSLMARFLTACFLTAQSKI